MAGISLQNAEVNPLGWRYVLVAGNLFSRLEDHTAKRNENGASKAQTLVTVWRTRANTQP